MGQVAGDMATHFHIQHGVGKGVLIGTPGLAPEIPYIIPLGGKESDVPRGGLPGSGLESNRPLGPLRSLPCAAHDSGPGRG